MSLSAGRLSSRAFRCAQALTCTLYVCKIQPYLIQGGRITVYCIHKQQIKYLKWIKLQIIIITLHKIDNCISNRFPVCWHTLVSCLPLHCLIIHERGVLFSFWCVGKNDHVFKGKRCIRTYLSGPASWRNGQVDRHAALALLSAAWQEQAQYPPHAQ